MFQKKILILGSTGFIGKRIFQQLSEQYDVYGTYHKQSMEQNGKWFYLDIATDGIKKILELIQPDIVISSLRGDFEQQLKIHSYLADYVKLNLERKLIFISTANVFDADQTRPFYEEDRINPSSDYGTYKAQCETMLQEALGEQCIIIRIPAVWGVNCPRIQQLRNSRQIDTVTNYDINITTDVQIAKTVKRIIDEDKAGIFHIGTIDKIDYYELQLKVCELLDIKKPEFKVEKEAETGNMILFTHRQDIQEMVSLTIADVLNLIKE